MRQPEDPRPAASTPPRRAEPRPPTFLQVVGAVFWSFFGVRKRRHMLQDATTIKPLYVIIVGLLSGLVFVFALLALVSFITRNAG